MEFVLLIIFYCNILPSYTAKGGIKWFIKPDQPGVFFLKGGF